MPTHKGTETIRTARLILRRFRAEDAEAMFRNWCSDPQVTKYLGWREHESAETTKVILSEWLPKYEDPAYYNWAIEYGGEAVGNINASVRDRHDAGELGYCLSRRLWNRGFMTEAVAAVTDFLFGEVSLHRVLIRNLALNPASGQVAENCGFRYEGTERGLYVLKTGGFADIEARSLLRDEWENRKRGSGFRLQTERLVLRPFLDSDFEAVHRYSSDPETTKYMFFGPNDEAATRRFLSYVKTEWSSREQRAYECAVILKDGGALAGGVSLFRTGPLGELGWILAPEYRMRGYASEAAGALMDWGFSELGLHRIRARCDARNERSRRVMERLGMRREALFRSARFVRGEWQDEYEYAKLKDE